MDQPEIFFTGFQVVGKIGMSQFRALGNTCCAARIEHDSSIFIRVDIKDRRIRGG
jgi:hypothetical protein